MKRMFFVPALFCIICSTLFAQVSTVKPNMLGSSVQAAERYNTDGGPVKFEFTYKLDDKSRILSQVQEDVFVNRRFHHHADIINRISMTVTDVIDDGSGILDGIFMTSEKSVGNGVASTFTWGEEYKTHFVRGTNGRYNIEDIYFMPTVRDVPLFPEKEVKPGESWTAMGHEAHDLRRQFDMNRPFKVPFEAYYTYLGTVKNENYEEGKSAAEFNVINVKYNMYMTTPTPSGASMYMEYPAKMSGYSDELIYWDAVRGTMDHYTENFRIVMESSYGNIYEFRGTAHAEVTEFERTATEEKVTEIQDLVNDLGLDNVTVKKSEKGLTLSIENIQFQAESAVLIPSEMRKIEALAKILEAYPNNDILVSGHTAHVAGGEDPQTLSENRAKSVAKYLIDLGVRDQYHIFTKGFGDTQPIATNDTREGRAKNRRVEITIMDE